MSKIQNFAEITPNLPFSESNFYDLYRETFEKSELGKVALMFLKMKTQMSFPKLKEELNGNIHYQLFCDILIDPVHPLTNYKLLDDIAAELAGKLSYGVRGNSFTLYQRYDNSNALAINLL